MNSSHASKTITVTDIEGGDMLVEKKEAYRPLPIQSSPERVAVSVPRVLMTQKVTKMAKRKKAEVPKANGFKG